ncbi:hypothetical protein [Demequina sp.]|uniref:hypothetical protein n=1 Tax=Demequina sp. TaxID=2050685 RepID=UPI003D0C3C9C
MTEGHSRLLYERLTELFPAGWRDAAPWGYPHQVELALIAGVFRAQTPQANADAVVDYVMRSRPSSLLDDLPELIVGGVDGVVKTLGSGWGDTNVLGVPVLRAAVIHDAAQALVGLGVNSGDDLRRVYSEAPDAVEGAVLGVRGLGRVTWDWIGVLAQVPLRPDPEFVVFVGRLVGEKLSPAEVADLVRPTARKFALDDRDLSHAIRELIRARAA